jgi:hypothetical protein
MFLFPLHLSSIVGLLFIISFTLSHILGVSYAIALTPPATVWFVFPCVQSRFYPNSWRNRYRYLIFYKNTLLLYTQTVACRGSYYYTITRKFFHYFCVHWNVSVLILMRYVTRILKLRSRDDYMLSVNQ